MWENPPTKYQFTRRKSLSKRGNRGQIAFKVRGERDGNSKRSRRAENTENERFQTFILRIHDLIKAHQSYLP
tara:strand:+ start:76 stop:291 length:216 start_codon:yes stop_codon:yes gene_type:complete